jgi:CRISPR/Cas system-associated exonuclease Cas4 (RecB family)
VVLFDMRTGRAYEEEERFNRWYAALLDLFKSGIAPARVVTWYAESQEVIAEELDNDKLEAAVRRVAGGVTRMVELDMGAREPTINPGWRCSLCRLSESCGPGLGYLSSTSNA